MHSENSRKLGKLEHACSSARLCELGEGSDVREEERQDCNTNVDDDDDEIDHVKPFDFVAALHCLIVFRYFRRDFAQEKSAATMGIEAERDFQSKEDCCENCEDR
jgi:hypothetical protein